MATDTGPSRVAYRMETNALVVDRDEWLRRSGQRGKRHPIGPDGRCMSCGDTKIGAWEWRFGDDPGKGTHALAQSTGEVEAEHKGHDPETCFTCHVCGYYTDMPQHTMGCAASIHSNLTQQVEEARKKARQQMLIPKDTALDGIKEHDQWLDRLIALERAEAVWIQHYPDCSFTFDNCERVADVMNAIAAIMEAP